MKRIAIFVEGHGELIFVREFLLKWFEWNVEVQCLEVRSSNYFPTEYDNLNPTASFHFQIWNVGSDLNVLPEMKRRANKLFNNGYTKIVGLRDMFGDQYKKLLEKRNRRQEIDNELNNKIQFSNENQIKDFLTEMQLTENCIQMCFSIMELEAWILSFSDLQARIDTQLTNDFIYKNLNINLLEIDTETTFFHPKEKLKAIWELVGKNYGKHQKEMNEIMGHLDKNDFEELLESGKCNSFKHFVTSLTLLQA